MADIETEYGSCLGVVPGCSAPGAVVRLHRTTEDVRIEYACPGRGPGPMPLGEMMDTGRCVLCNKLTSERLVTRTEKEYTSVRKKHALAAVQMNSFLCDECVWKIGQDQQTVDPKP